jgi:hypothetical protein
MHARCSVATGFCSRTTSLAITPISRLCLRTRERIRSSRFIVGREITGAPALLPDGFRRVIGKTLRFLEKSYSDLALCVSCAENAHHQCRCILGSSMK